jgi:predicted RNA-binding Zn-ribbon protein involved in translation (DUF1610 family)
MLTNRVGDRFINNVASVVERLRGIDLAPVFRLAKAGRFFTSRPMDRLGIMPTGYEYREYKNCRGVPKPWRCPFCKQAKGEISKANRMYQDVCPNCGTTVPKCLVTLRNLETSMRTHQYCDMRRDSCH